MRLVIRVAILTVTIWAMSGCSSAPPAEWLLYSKANYLYGRAEAKAEMVCAMGSTSDPSLRAFCAEAAATQQEVRTLNPLIQAQLSQNKPDWAKILQYMDLATGLAGKLFMAP